MSEADAQISLGLSNAIGFRNCGLDRLGMALVAHAKAQVPMPTELVAVDYGSADAAMVRLACGARRLRLLSPIALQEASSNLAPAGWLSGDR